MLLTEGLDTQNILSHLMTNFYEEEEEAGGGGSGPQSATSHWGESDQSTPTHLLPHRTACCFLVFPKETEEGRNHTGADMLRPTVDTHSQGFMHAFAYTARKPYSGHHTSGNALRDSAPAGGQARDRPKTRMQED